MSLFRKSAGYRYLDAFVLANVVELATGHFCHDGPIHKKLGEEFVEGGGFRERLSTVRSEARSRQGGGGQEGPPCPQCGSPTRLRRRRKDNKPFWGCTEYPACRGIVDYEKDRSGRGRGHGPFAVFAPPAHFLGPGADFGTGVAVSKGA